VADPATFAQPIDDLHRLWREGAPLGVHLLGWWAGPRAYSDQVGMETVGTVDVTMLLRVSSQDVIDVFGPFVTWAAPTNRALVRDIAAAAEPTVVVPFAPLTSADIRTLTQLRVDR
jgi:hypothetical protein